MTHDMSRYVEEALWEHSAFPKYLRVQRGPQLLVP